MSPARVGRPKKVRYMQHRPPVTQFSPRGKPGRPDVVTISFEEFEALKLSDYQGFSQCQGAGAMRISRSSFGRILRSVRKKVAEAITNGKTIKISMGEAQVGIRSADFSIVSLREDMQKFKSSANEIITLSQTSKPQRSR